MEDFFKKMADRDPERFMDFVFKLSERTLNSKSHVKKYYK